LGIFTYCFCTFFMAGFFNTELLKKIWFIHNFFDVLVYFMFAAGFFATGIPRSRNRVQ
jgi:hypothetical protein